MMNKQIEELKFLLSESTGCKIRSLEKIGNGRNSRVYRLITENSTRYTAKFYFCHPADKRNRLEVEFASLHFLWDNGERAIPRPIATSRDHGFAIYQYIDGKKIAPDEVTDSDIDDAAEFLGRLGVLSKKTESKYQPRASEACFSIQDILSSIELRLNRLTCLVPKSTANDVLQDFLALEFKPALDEITRYCMSKTAQYKMPATSNLSYEESTLSPSDFGFHNALRLENRKAVYLDFEYFGWDDPAKMIADFLLHPAMSLGDDHKKRFMETILGRFSGHKYLPGRIEIVYPLHGLKWCLILLNEFVPEHLKRRGFANGNAMDLEELQKQQLAKSRKMLARIRSEYEYFPYSFKTR